MTGAVAANRSTVQVGTRRCLFRTATGPGGVGSPRHSMRRRCRSRSWSRSPDTFARIALPRGTSGVARRAYLSARTKGAARDRRRSEMSALRKERSGTARGRTDEFRSTSASDGR